MGILDRLKAITFGRPKETKKAPELPAITLKAQEQDKWVEQLLQDLGVESAFIAFSNDTRRQVEELQNLAKTLASTDVLKDVPERAHTITALHANEYAGKLKKFLDKIEFTDLFLFNEEQEEFAAAYQEFKERTAKNAAALQEYCAEQMTDVMTDLDRLEDTIIGFLQELDDLKFGAIEEVHAALSRLQEYGKQQTKYDTLAGELEEQQKEAKERRESIEQKMQQQRNLIRNQAALHALEKLSELEQELDDMSSKYEKSCRDAVKYYKKYDETRPPKRAAQVITDLPKDPSRYLAENAAAVKDAFNELTEQLEQEGRGNLGNLLSRLREQSSDALRDGARTRDILPEQLQLRKEMMKDVAALNIYDQQQFLLRARREEQDAQAKLMYVQEQIGGGKRVALEHQLYSAVRDLGATIEGGSAAQEEPANEDEARDLDEDISTAEEDLKEEKTDLDDVDMDVEESAPVRISDDPDAEIRTAEDLIQEVEAEMGKEYLAPKVERHHAQPPKEDHGVYLGPESDEQAEAEEEEMEKELDR